MTRRDDAKRHPDRDSSRHDAHASQHAADEDRTIDCFTDPADAPAATDDLAASPGDADKLLPEILDDSDHAGLNADVPSDHPGGTVEEQMKGLPARWGKARP
jgi:hypothetical protein